MTEASLTEIVERYRLLFDRGLHSIYVHDLEGNFLDANRAALDLLGYTRDEIPCLSISSLVDKDQLPLALKMIKEIKRRGSQKCPMEFRIRKKNGEYIWVETAACIISRNERSYAVQGIALDITKRKRMELELRNLSLIDSLTGVYNRRGFFMHAEQQMKIVSRAKKRMTLMFIDVDNLKSINDSRGHGEGDKVLAEAAKFLSEVFRESDVIARVGGDEFVVLVLENSGIMDASSLLVRLATNIAAHNTSEERIALSLSVGMACYQPDHPCSIDELLSQADRLMYRQKREKRRYFEKNSGSVYSSA